MVFGGGPVRQVRRWWGPRLLGILLFLILTGCLSACSYGSRSSRLLALAQLPFGGLLRRKYNKNVEVARVGDGNDSLMSELESGLAAASIEAVDGGYVATEASDEPDDVLLAAEAELASGKPVRKYGRAAGQSPAGERYAVYPGILGRGEPFSAPFVRHYSKHMAILWEWYTKTIGATMNGKRKQDEDVRAS